MKKLILSILLCLCLTFNLRPVNASAEETSGALTAGNTYYFDLSDYAGIGGTTYNYLPDSTMHFVPFTYAGRVSAYSLDSAEDTDYSSYDHELFVMNHYVKSQISWDTLNNAGLVYGTALADGLTLRLLSGGNTQSDTGATPANNEWDVLVNVYKSLGLSMGNGLSNHTQDNATNDTSRAVSRGYRTSENAISYFETLSKSYAGPSDSIQYNWRPAVSSTASLVPVTLNLAGGTMGGNNTIQMVHKQGSDFTAPATSGVTKAGYNLTRWIGSDTNSYTPGDTVPASVTTLTAVWSDGATPAQEQFTLPTGETYYFDLSDYVNTFSGCGNYAVGYTGESTWTYVPFVYAGTVNSFNSSGSSNDFPGSAVNRSDRSLFLSEYDLISGNIISTMRSNSNGLFYGQGGNYDKAGTDAFTLRLPSGAVSDWNPVQSFWVKYYYVTEVAPWYSEWDQIFLKGKPFGGWIKNDTTIAALMSLTSDHMYGNSDYYCARYSVGENTAFINMLTSGKAAWRPVLEVSSSMTTDPEAMSAVTLKLSGGSINGQSSVKIVRSGTSYTAPAATGITRPAGNTGDYLIWKDSADHTYAPGDTIPISVTELTAVWEIDPPIPATWNSAGGYYEISNAGQLKWFSRLVNGTLSDTVQNKAANGKLLNDVTAGSSFEGIGTESSPYTGTFDGGSHTVTLSINRSNTSCQGLFGAAGGGATVKNVGVAGTVNGGAFTAGLIGGSNGSGTVTIRNCWNEAVVTSTAENAAGIFGCNINSSATLIIENCYNIGTISGNRESGGISGWLGNNATVLNCYNAGTVTGIEIGKTFARYSSATFTNCYQLDTIGTQVSVTAKTLSAFHSGEVCYLLNGDNVTEGTRIWFQNIDNGQTADTYPKFSGGTVYKVADEYSNQKAASTITTMSGDIFKSYDGMAFELSATKGMHFTWDGTGTATIEGYYTDANGNTPTSIAGSGAAREGAAPVNAGSYYVKVSVTADDNFLASTAYIPFKILYDAPVTGISLDHDTLTLKARGTATTLTAAIEPENATNKNLSWSSGNTAVATVTDGVVTPLAQGSTKITVTTLDGSYRAECIVTVEASECPASYYGVQKRTNEDGTRDIRLIGLINTLESEKVGFVYSVSEEVPAIGKVGCFQLSTNKVYSSITVNGTTTTAASLGGDYIIVGTVKNIASLSSDKLYVCVYVKKSDGTTYSEVKELLLSSLQ